MRKVILFIAMSLDGYIAGADGNVDWLGGQDSSTEIMGSYDEFIKDIDTVVMGWNTYHQITRELSPDEWMYKELTSYIVTHREQSFSDGIRFVDQDPCDLIKMLKQKPGKDIWVCGGANIIQQLLQEDLIEQFYISVIPTLLGRGIRLFEPFDREIPLSLIKTKTYHGITDLVYEYRHSSQE